MGHSHEDQLSVSIRINLFLSNSSAIVDLRANAQIYYANNATNISAQTAAAVNWIGPSITPLTNLNSGFRMYEVDSKVSNVL